MSPTIEQQQTQKALIVPEKQAPFVLTTRSIPAPKAGEILVKLKAISLNPIDWKIQSSGYMVERYPAVLGVDAAGEVVSTGDSVEGFQEGDNVFFQAIPPLGADYGAFQEYALAMAGTASKIPKNLRYAQAATVPLTFATAAIGLFAEAPSGAGLNPTWDLTVKHVGKSALVFGGSTSVGHYAIQLLKSVGFTHIIAYASATHTESLKAIGATSIIDRDQVSANDLTEAVAKISGQVDIVYDTISSPEGQSAGYAALANNGHLLSVRATPHAYVPKDESLTRGRKVTSVLGSPHMPSNRVFGKIMYEKIGGLLEEGTIVPTQIEELSGLETVVSGLERLKEGKISGKKLIVSL